MLSSSLGLTTLQHLREVKGVKSFDHDDLISKTDLPPLAVCPLLNCF